MIIISYTKKFSYKFTNWHIHSYEFGNQRKYGECKYKKGKAKRRVMAFKFDDDSGPDCQKKA